MSHISCTLKVLHLQHKLLDLQSICTVCYYIYLLSTTGTILDLILTMLLLYSTYSMPISSCLVKLIKLKFNTIPEW